MPGLGGLSIHHAMIHSLPIISVAADGTEVDLIHNNENGFIIENDNIEQLVEKILFILDGDNKIKFGNKSRQIVDEKINILNMVNVFRYSFFK